MDVNDSWDFFFKFSYRATDLMVSKVVPRDVQTFLHDFLQALVKKELEYFC